MKLFYPFILGVSVALQGQVISSSKWDDIFSYNNVSHIREANGKLFVSTENGIFTYDTKSGEVAKFLSKANGLHNINIRAFDYNPETKMGLVGYADGSLDVIAEDGVSYVVDAPISTSYTGTKTINHIHIQGNRAVISADYGVSIFNLDRKEFSETAFFPTPAQEAVISNNKIYAIIGNEILVYDLSNLVGFNIRSNWTAIPITGNFKNITTNNEIVAFSTSNTFYFGNEGNFRSVSNFDDIRDININNDKIIVADRPSIDLYDFNGSFIAEQSFSNQEINTGWATGEKIFAGTKNEGLLDANASYTPSGPYTNRATKISLLEDKIWVATGTRNDGYNEIINTLPSLGFYFYNGSEWIYPSFFKNNPTYFNILDVVGSPSDYRETFFSNYSINRGQGFYKLFYDNTRKDFDLKKYYSEEQDNIWFNRPVGFAYDENNNLFATSAFYMKDNKAFARYAWYSPSSDTFVYNSIEAPNGVGGGIQSPIYHNGKLYISLPRQPLFAIVNLNNTPTNLNDDSIDILDESNGLISGYPGNVISAIVDKNSELWLGERGGMRVANTIPSNVSETKAKPIIIEQRGLGEELFRDAQILHIEVDDSNNKWVSVNGGGVFYLSPNGQQTILHFTKENSPLPNNIVTDIKINKQTGKVYFVTQNGIVTYQSDVKNTNARFGEVLVYPNPVVYAQHKGNVRIKGLAQKTFIRITDTAGNLVHQAEARGGWYDWDLTNRGKRVASGIYFVLMTNEDGTDTATAKIAVIN